jgi:hypothetical protein
VKEALKWMRAAKRSLSRADRRMRPSMNAEPTNTMLHRSADCLEFAIAGAESWLEDHPGADQAAKRDGRRPAAQVQRAD